MNQKGQNTPPKTLANAKRLLNGATRNNLLAKQGGYTYKKSNLTKPMNNLNQKFREVTSNRNKSFLENNLEKNGNTNQLTRNMYKNLLTLAQINGNVTRNTVIKAIVKILTSLDFDTPQTVKTLNLALKALSTILITKPGNGKGGPQSPPIQTK